MQEQIGLTDTPPVTWQQQDNLLSQIEAIRLAAVEAIRALGVDEEVFSVDVSFVEGKLTSD